MKKIMLTLLSLLLCLIFVAPIEKVALAHTADQTDWSGGVSSEVISFDNLLSWKKYSSGSGIDTTRSPGYINLSEPGVSGWLISSPIDIGNHEVSAISGSAGGTTLYGRSASTVVDLSSAPWVQGKIFSAGAINQRYFQYKIVITFQEESMIVALRSKGVLGQIRDASTNLGINGASVTAFGITKQSDTNVFRSGEGYYSISTDYIVGDSMTFEISVSASGYQTKKQTAMLIFKNNAYATDLDILLEKATSGQSTCTKSVSGQSSAAIKSSKYPKSSVIFDKTIATADGKDTINVSILIKNSSGTIITNKKTTVTVTGNGNTVSDFVLDTSTKTWKGTVLSTKAEVKTVLIKIDSELLAEQQITFVSPGISLTNPIINVRLNNENYVESEIKTFTQGQSVEISGLTFPNTTVILYIFSDPKTAEITADAKENWNYTITDLELGDHRVEAEIIDPTTNQKSERTTIAKFSIVKAVESTFIGKLTSNPYLSVGLGVLFLTILSGIGYWLWKRKRQKLISPNHNI